MSDFAGLRLALSSLYTHQRALEVTGQNIANANTEGYSRQRVDMQNIAGPVTPAIWATWNGTGGGVQVADVARFRDAFLEVRAALEHGAQAHLEQSKSALDQLEQLFAEPSDIGISTQLTDFWAGWDDVANHPSDMSARTQLLQRATTLAASFNTAASSINALRQNTITQLNALVAEVNTTAQNIAQLNQAIKSAEIAGLSANDLKDQCDLLANKLAEMTGSSLRNAEFGQVNVVLNGTSLVSENHYEALKVDTSGATVALRYVGDNHAAVVNSGKAGGMLEAINVTYPGYLSDLDTIATQLRDDVNGVHGAISGAIAATDRDQSTAGNLQFDVALNGGVVQTVTVAGADWSGAGGAAALQTALQTAMNGAIGAGNGVVSVTGGVGQPLAVSVAPSGTNTLTVQAAGTNAGFGTLLGTTPVGQDGVGGRQLFEGADALTLHVAAALDGNPAGIAAGTAVGGPLDASLALELAELGSSATGADSLYRSLVVTIGVQAQTTTRRADIQGDTTNQVDAARNANAGVNIDEEMVNMIQYQHAYDAAARFMTAIDEMLNTLINQTGVVGR